MNTHASTYPTTSFDRTGFARSLQWSSLPVLSFPLSIPVRCSSSDRTGFAWSFT